MQITYKAFLYNDYVYTAPLIRFNNIHSFMWLINRSYFILQRNNCDWPVL